MDRPIARLYSYPPETVQAIAEIEGVAKKQVVERCDKYAKEKGNCAKKKKKKK